MTTATSYVPANSVVTAIQFSANILDVLTFANTGKDPSLNSVCVPNETNMFVLTPGKAAQTAHATDWIVQKPDGSLEVHTNADFQASFVAK